MRKILCRFGFHQFTVTSRSRGIGRVNETRRRCLACRRQWIWNYSGLGEWLKQPRMTGDPMA